MSVGRAGGGEAVMREFIDSFSGELARVCSLVTLPGRDANVVESSTVVCWCCCERRLRICMGWWGL